MFSNIRSVAFAAFVAIFATATTPVFAQRPIALPLGATVNYFGTKCGQINGKWVPGAINNSGKFTPTGAQIKSLQAKIKRTPRSQRGPLQRQLKALQKKATKQQQTCSVLQTNITAPTTNQSALPGFVTIDGTTDLQTKTDANLGEELNFFCPPNTAQDSIWGTDTYSADSSICDAAIHVGAIRRQNGGNVRVRIKPGQTKYIGSLRNGVNSQFYTNYRLSYSFINMATGEEVSSAAPPIVPWSFELAIYRAEVGAEFLVLCHANGSDNSIWGTDTYTDDSGVCTAAVHAGKISKLQGGVVRVQIAPGVTSYTGSKRRGITSLSYGNWGGSIVFP